MGSDDDDSLDNSTKSLVNTGTFPAGKDQESPWERRVLELSTSYGPMTDKTKSLFLDLFRTLKHSQTISSMDLFKANEHWGVSSLNYGFLSAASCSYAAIDEGDKWNF